MRIGPSTALAAAALLYVGFRALVLHANFDAVAIPVYELPVMGNLAHLASSPERGVPLVRYYDNCGGHLVTGLLAAPLYALFGASYLSLKLVPLGLGLVTLGLLWSALAAHYDRRAAGLFAFLFALAPPTLLKYSLLAKGNHFENLAFQAAVLALFLGLHARGASPRRLFVIGVAAGFALFVYFGSIVLLAVLAVLHVLVRGRRALADLPAGLGGLAVGLAPLAWVQLAGGGRPLQFLSAKLRGASADSAGGLRTRLGSFFSDVLPQSAAFEDLGPIPGRVAEYAFFAAFVLSWLYLTVELAWRHRRRASGAEPLAQRERELSRFERWKALPFVAYLPLFALLVSTTDFRFAHYSPPVEVGRYRYLVPHFTLALVAIALAAARLSRRPGAPRLAGAGLAALALATSLFTLPIAHGRGSEPGLGRVYSGTHFHQYANVVMRGPDRDLETKHPRWDASALQAALEGLTPAHRREAYVGIGHYLAWAAWFEGPAAPGAPWLSLARLVESYPELAQVALARGAGSFLRRMLGTSRALGELERELCALEAEGHPLLPWVVEGLCLDVHYPLVRDILGMVGTSTELEAAVSADLRASMRRGRGAEAGRLAARGLGSDLALVRHLIASFPDGGCADFWFGVGWGMAEGAGGGALPPTFDRVVPPEQRERALEGYGASLRDAHGPAPPLCALAPADRAAAERGAHWPEHPAPRQLSAHRTSAW